jgi:drug/metabolite transporter (DMT)-like permease
MATPDRHPACLARAFMGQIKTPTLKTSILVTLLVILDSAGNFFFSLGMKRIGALRGGSMQALHAAFVGVFFSVWIWLGIVSMLLFLAALMLVLSWADFSYVLPSSAAMYAVVPLLGHFVLNESVTALRWLGVTLICLGIILVGRTPPNTTQER